MGILLCRSEVVFLWGFGRWVTLEQVCGTASGMSMPFPAVGDSVCGCDESASTSAGESIVEPESESLPSVSSVLHSLSLGKGMDRLLQMITCGFPWRRLRAASLYVMGSLGRSEYEAVLVWLSGESGLSTSNSSPLVLGVVGAEQELSGIRVSINSLALGRGTTVDM